jgi:hypothetical protein
MVRVHFDRDSVAMGDDMYSHARDLDLSAATPIDSVVRMAELASIAGGKACWVIAVGPRRGTPVAVWAQQWSRARLLDPAAATVGDLASDGRLDVYFEYFTQLDPDRIFELLRSGIVDRGDLRTAYYAALSDNRVAAEVVRAASTRDRLLPADAIAALERMGVTIRAHSDVALFATAADRDYEMLRDDHDGPMIYVHCPRPEYGSNRWLSWLSHPDDAARMLLGQVGEHAREVAGLEPFPWPATDYPVGDEWRQHHWRSSWTSGGTLRKADFSSGNGIPEPFARIALLDLTCIAEAYPRG